MPPNPPKSSVLIHCVHTATSTTSNTASSQYQNHRGGGSATLLFNNNSNNNGKKRATVPEAVTWHHTHAVGPNQCCSAVTQEIVASVSTVWSEVWRLANPHVYKHFVKRFHVIEGDDDVGTMREVQVISGLPANSSTERLEILDDESHVISFSMMGGDHRLSNYRSASTETPNRRNTTPIVDDSSTGLSDTIPAPTCNAMIFEALSPSTDPNGLDTSAIASFIDGRMKGSEY
ncbi:hypothetical protein C1H46_031323 [Malus baccata]|uniref:Bet v I/Major latex protein domain-containing protein n=1 Tax=Malus baccata TaxID=106549 RepID=A0A540LA05_MALBA|nr:hypothetical protein C1H46_031323 [Malus baccata]